MAKSPITRSGSRPTGNRFERELEMLEAMSGQELDAVAIECIRKALNHANNYIVSKAARLVSNNKLSSLLPEVLAAYDRFFQDAVKSDPQCWAKNELIKALVALECRDSKVYLRGLNHVQEEPAWGGQSDTAGALRGACTHALVDCPEIKNDELLDILLAPLVDRDKTVRVEAVRAIGHIGGASARLLLKLRVLLGKDEAEVLGACFSALLGLDCKGDSEDKTTSIPLVAAFLEDGEEAAAEAAFALAETHHPMALKALIDRRRKRLDEWFGSVLDNSIALTRLPEGIDYLIGVIEQGGYDERSSASALDAISRVSLSAQTKARVAAAVDQCGSELLRIEFRKFYPQVDSEA